MADVRVYTLDEVADILHLTKRTLYTYVKQGTLHAVKFGKYWRVPAESLEAFISTGTPVANSNKRSDGTTN